MKLKLSKITLAVAALSTAPAAFALTPADIRAAGSNVAYVWLSGASAPSNGVFRSVLSLCNGVGGNSGTADVHEFLEGTGTEPGKSSGDRVAYTCTPNASAVAGTALAGKKLVVYHTVENGSFNAYSPHLKVAGDTNPELLPDIRRIADLTGLDAAGRCANGAAVSTPITINGVTTNIGRYNSCNGSNLVTKTFTTTLKGDALGLPGQSYPDGGFSDTEYPINKQNLKIATDLDVIGTEVATNVGQVFGVGVSYPLYYQLQKNEINPPAGSLFAGHPSASLAASCIAAPFTPASPNLTPACQPSISAQSYTAIAFKDTGVTWNASLFYGPANGVVHLARRVPTSGSQSASNARFLGIPCSTGGLDRPIRASDSTNLVKVTEESSTGNVKTRLNTASLAGEFGLGVLSLENTPAPTATADRWAFVKLNRVSPNLFPDNTLDPQQRVEALKGNYDFWYELAAFTSANARTPASAAGADLIAKVVENLGSHDLKGLFATPAAGTGGPDFTSLGARVGNSCQPQIQ